MKEKQLALAVISYWKSLDIPSPPLNQLYILAEELIKEKDQITRTNFFQGRPLWREHHREESERLQRILIDKGFTSCSVGDAEGLWMQYSDSYAAGFLEMPFDDKKLYELIKDQLVIIEKTFIG